MIALATFPIAGLACWAHYEFIGRVIIAGTPLTVWRAWYASVLIAALVDVLRSDNQMLRAAWAIMALSFLASFMTWDLSSRPALDNAARMIAVGGALLIISREPAIALSAALHGVVALAAYASYEAGIMPTHMQRPKAFLAYSFPDISAGLQHVALVILGVSAGMGAISMGRFNRRGSNHLSGGVSSVARSKG